MKIIDITNEKFDSLKLLEKGLSLESELYMFDENTILKRIYKDFKEQYDNKLYTLKELNKNIKIINIPELIIPDSLVKIDSEVIGFLIPYIEGNTLEEVLKSNSYTIKQKIECLKQVGIILEQMQKVRKNTKVNNFYLNDIHEGNFILNKNTNKINVIDLDSCKIGNNQVGCAKYLSPLSPIMSVPKYKKIENSIGSIYEISENTDLYCYIIMVLNFIFNNNINKLYIKDYYNYLEYLISIGVSKELVDKLSYIYMDKDNENIYEYLDELIPCYGKTDEKVYENSKFKIK